MLKIRTQAVISPKPSWNYQAIAPTVFRTVGASVANILFHKRLSHEP